MAERALEGLRVVALGDFISAAYATKLLADLGADVVKVEPPAGDSIRAHGPFPGDVEHPETGALQLFLNANKRGAVIDLAAGGAAAASERERLLALASPRRRARAQPAAAGDRGARPDVCGARSGAP